MSTCTTASVDRRRVFWTTQPDACGSAPDCTTDCGRAGLRLTSSLCGAAACDCCPPPAEDLTCSTTLAARALVPRSIVTTGWVRSLVLNILQTNGKLPASSCGFRPGAQGGHWSESYRTDGQRIGTLLRNIPASQSILKSIALIRAQLQADLARLVVIKIAQKVTVETTYLGGNVMRVDISIIAPNGTQIAVGLSGKRSTVSWAWS